MKIDENEGIIEFKTIPPFFQREKDGRKTNTVRRISGQSELQSLLSSLFVLSKIRIINWDNEKERFERILTDISYYDGLYIFSWIHIEDDFP